MKDWNAKLQNDMRDKNMQSAKDMSIKYSKDRGIQRKLLGMGITPIQASDDEVGKYLADNPGFAATLSTLQRKYSKGLPAGKTLEDVVREEVAAAEKLHGSPSPSSGSESTPSTPKAA